MPSTPLKNMLYRAALPFLAPSCHGQLTHQQFGHSLTSVEEYERILYRHHVFGASLLLSQGNQAAGCLTSTEKPLHVASKSTMFRVASITKMATALVTLRCIDEKLFELDTPIADLLEDGASFALLQGVTVRHLLSHTSGMRDPARLEASLREHRPWTDLLIDSSIRAAEPGQQMIYSNLGFGLLGSILETTTGLCIEELFQTKLFQPLHMRATLDAATLLPEDLMPIVRILPYHPQNELRASPLGNHPLKSPDPSHHYGYTAGALYTDAQSVMQMLQLIHDRGLLDGQRLISEGLMNEMTTRQASTSTRTYGLGLVILNRPEISDCLLFGHQGFAYGCVDGAFIEEKTGRAVVFLNGGASEARDGRLALVNRDLLIWAMKQELPTWKKS